MEIDYREMRRLDAMHFDLTLMLSADIRLRILSLLSMLGSYFTAALLHLMASKNFSIPKRNAIHTQKKVSNSWNISNTEQYDSQHMLNSSLIYGSRIQWKCMDAVNSTPCLSIDRSQETPSFIQLSIKLWLLFELFSMQFFFQFEYFFSALFIR